MSSPPRLIALQSRTALPQRRSHCTRAGGHAWQRTIVETVRGRSISVASHPADATPTVLADDTLNVEFPPETTSAEDQDEPVSEED